MDATAQANFDELIPELKTWNDGKHISVDVWLSNYGDVSMGLCSRPRGIVLFTHYDSEFRGDDARWASCFL